MYAMLNIAPVPRIFIACGCQDMRRGIDTLSLAITTELGHDPYSGDCFLFLSKNRRRLKMLIWEKGGFWLCLKRLEAGTFVDPNRWHSIDGKSVSITLSQMHLLLEGIDIYAARYRVRQDKMLDKSGSFVRSKHERVVLATRTRRHRLTPPCADNAP